MELVYRVKVVNAGKKERAGTSPESELVSWRILVYVRHKGYIIHHELDTWQKATGGERFVRTSSDAIKSNSVVFKRCAVKWISPRFLTIVISEAFRAGAVGGARARRRHECP
ncbi:hypothetical protein EVAR_60831_1 [Eumeta japonica]|uniref:Uncharacterized protein n=1 Tax=Eumeta variegata TaxID=151549 RepID=A0A4C1Y5V5_EUMVA|nr:hypothetical protein EVAR_60831_1 [Eumeta japonica]